MRESPSSEVSLHGGLVKAADPHLDPHEETSGRKQWKHGCERVFQSQRKRSKTSGKRYFQNFSTLCNQQVGGSSPSTSSNLSAAQQSEYGGIPEWPKGADCKSVVSDFGGSNPPSPTKLRIERCGVLIFSRRFPNYFMSFCKNGIGSHTTIFGRKPVLFFAFPASSDRASWSELSGLLSFSERH